MKFNETLFLTLSFKKLPKYSMQLKKFFLQVKLIQRNNIKSFESHQKDNIITLIFK